jgi:hypothetical protein
MNFTEEHVTRAAARKLVERSWEIVATHPPDGQGPFVIPKSPTLRNIERGSYHPDIVGIRPDQKFGARVLIVECKLDQQDLEADEQKLRTIASDTNTLLYILFRCKRFKGGPECAVDFDSLDQVPNQQLPVDFLLVAAAEINSSRNLAPASGHQFSKLIIDYCDLY